VVLNPPEPIRIHVQTGGTVAWNGSPVPMATLQAQFDVEGARDVQPTIEITTDADAEYETLAKVLARTKNAGLLKISFVEESLQ
jgi:biopolymer transport protein ExbD